MDKLLLFRTDLYFFQEKTKILLLRSGKYTKEEESNNH